MAFLSMIVSLLALVVGIDAVVAAREVPLTGPTPRLLVYVQTFHVNDGNSSTPLSLLPLRDEHTGITHVIFAMTHLSTTPGIITMNDNSYDAPMFDSAWSDAKQLQAAGIKVMACLGGAGDISYDNLAANFDAIYGPLRDLIKKYSLDGLDLDVEKPLDLAIILKLINSLYNDMGPDFLISLAPVASALRSTTGSNISGFSYFDLDSQAAASSGKKLVSWYNTQFYSGYGSAEDATDYDTIIAAGWDPARIVMGVLAGYIPRNGFVNTSTIQTTVSSLRAKYPKFGGVDGWEYFDAGATEGYTQPYQWVQAISSSMFGTASKRDVEPLAAAPAFPTQPFAFAEDAGE